VSEEEMLLRLEASDEEIAVMRAAPRVRVYEPLDATAPLVTLVEQLTRRGDRGYIHVQKGDLSLTLARHDATTPSEAPVGA
jgi:transketolase C-terminal domain/subunit